MKTEQYWAEQDWIEARIETLEAIIEEQEAETTRLRSGSLAARTHSA